MATQASADIHEPGYLRSPVIESAELFDRIPDGLMICAEDQRIQWVNQPFMQMYHLPDRAAAVGLAFDEVYRHAWSVGGEGDMAPFYDGLSTLQEHMRFAGAPFEVPLPRSRWSRVIAKQGSDGTVFYAHVDITELKRQQRLLAQAERSARDSEAQLREKSILLEATLEQMDQGVAKISATGVAELCNRRAMELLDLPAELMASKSTLVNMLVYLRARGEFQGASQEVLDLPWKPKVFWMQLGIRSIEARQLLARTGMTVVEDSCIMVEHARLLPNAAPGRTQRQLDDLQQRFDSYQNEVVTHFNTTASLVKKLTQSYQEVQDHLADGANRLALDDITRQRLLAAHLALYGLEKTP